jgi:hypothetical protein
VSGGLVSWTLYEYGSMLACAIHDPRDCGIVLHIDIMYSRLALAYNGSC